MGFLQQLMSGPGPLNCQRSVLCVLKNHAVELDAHLRRSYCCPLISDRRFSSISSAHKITLRHQNTSVICPITSRSLCWSKGCPTNSVLTLPSSNVSTTSLRKRPLYFPNHTVTAGLRILSNPQVGVVLTSKSFAHIKREAVLEEKSLSHQKSHNILFPTRTMSVHGKNPDQMSSASSSVSKGEAPASDPTRLKDVSREAQTTREAREIFNQAVNAVLPSQMIRNSLQFDPASATLRVSGQEYKVDHNVYVVGLGKAVLGMARAVEDCLGSHLVRGVISVPSGVVTALVEAGKEDMLLSSQSRIRVMEGAKDNLPDQAAQAAAQEIHTLANGLQDGDLLVVLISGGGSALLPAPIAPVTLDEVMDVTRRMARAGASIVQLNAVRKQLEALKGGGLAEAAQPARVISLILSDVIGDPLDFIASGPTVPDRTTPEECLDLFAQLSIQDSIPESVKTLLTSTKSETQDQARSVDWSRVHNVLVGTNKIACEKAKETSDELGYQSIILSTELEGEAREVSQMFATLASYISLLLVDGLSSGNNREEEIQKLERSLLVYPSLSVDKLKEIRQLAVRAKEMQRGVCIISGGETTVMVKGNGRGGRNQEMAVSAALELQRFLPASAQTDLTVQTQDSSTSKTCDEISRLSVVFLAAGTDGQDGPTPVAGAVVSPRFCEQAQSSGVNVIEFLDRNDSYNLLTQVDEGANLVVPGLTGTNVMDIQVLLVKPGV